MSESVNESARELLHNYILHTPSGEFALMLSGSWGTGKTHFIKRELEPERFGLDEPAIYVSLNGVASESEVYDQILVQLSPIWHSNKAKKAKKIVGGLVFAATRYNAFGDDDNSFKLGIDFSKLDLGPSESEAHRARVVVFDDLERAEMNIKRAMGLINNFVEHSHAKVIILCAEKQLSDDQDYASIKEKVVGLTTPIEPEFESAVSDFIEQEKHEELSKFYQEQLDTIEEVFKASQSGNLRHLRIALMEFTRLVRTLEIENLISENTDFLQRLLKLHLMFQIEVRRGNMSSLDDFTVKYELPSDEEKPNQNRIEMLSEMYGQHVGHESILGLPNWFELSVEGRINSEKLKALVQETLQVEETRSWLQLWNWQSIDEQGFEFYKYKFLKDIKQSDFSAVLEIPHYLGLLLFFQSEEAPLCDWTTDEIIENIETATNTYLASHPEESLANIAGETSYAGYAYYHRGNPEFEQGKQGIDEAIKVARKAFFQGLSIKVLSATKDGGEHEKALYDFHTEAIKIDVTEVFDHLKPKDLTNVWISLLQEGYDISRACRMLTQEHPHFRIGDVTQTYFEVLRDELKKQVGSQLSPLLRLKANRTIGVLTHKYELK